jgi:glyoxylate reductase
VEERLAEQFDARVHRGPQLKSQVEVADFIADADAAISLLFNPVGEVVFERCSKLRVIANCAVGYDNIDLEAARRRRVWITNTPDVLTDATADLTMALILSVTRRLVEGDVMMRAGKFHGWALDLMLGHGLQGKTLGIVGFGRIGRAVAQRAQAFGMNVIWNDPLSPPPEGYQAQSLDLDDLLGQSQILSLHCPLTTSNYHLLDEKRLRSLPRGAYVINTARGPLIDERALVRLLEDGHLSGAGLDVYESEPVVDAGLLDRNDVVLLPHIGSATVETRTAMAELAMKNLVAVLESRQPPTPVVSPESF